jgi:ferrous iron transport protein B
VKPADSKSKSSSATAVAARPLVALVGNPNAGKTTLFNSLTGSFQKVGNYPGVTVERVSARLRLPELEVECVDVPGLYSLNAVSEDERVALEAVRGASGHPRPDVLVCVIDATNLERNLYLYSQLASLGIPIVVALTMSDRAPSTDIELLSQRLDCPVVPVVGHKGKGLTELKAAISETLRTPRTPAPVDLSDQAAEAAHDLRERMARLGMDLSEADSRAALESSEFYDSLHGYPEAREALQAAQSKLRDVAEEDEVAHRYRWAADVQKQVAQEPKGPRKPTLTDQIDRLLTHRVFGVGVFVAIMYLVFLSIYSFAGPLMDLIEGGFSWVNDAVSPHLEGIPWLQSLVVDGLIGGVGSVLVFLPQILILFFFISVLEGTGYLARAAFLMDRLLGWCGLNGRAFVPLLSSFACAIPGIMAARVMPDKNSRLATILIAPLMSCSARLPVYILLIGAFIEPHYGAAWAGFTLFAMHFLGLLVAIPIAKVLNRRMIKGKRLPFVLELPPYQMPKWRDVWIAMYSRGRVFVVTAGTIIVLMSVVIWFLSYFPRLSPEQEQRLTAEFSARQAEAARFIEVPTSEEAVEDEEAPSEEELLDRHLAEAQLEHSVLGRFGKTIEPVFVPAGFDWRITTSILAAFPARETVVPSLGIIFSLGGDVDEESHNLTAALQQATWPDGRPLFTVWTSIGLMVFFALCAQCMATLATVKRETNTWKWPVFMFAYMTILAYVGAVIVNLLGRIFGG